MHLKKIALKEIIGPIQAMRSKIEQEGINQLADSIMEIGLINPMTVTKKGLKYEIIAGNRRFIALKQLQIEFAECNVVEVPEEKLHQIKIDENYIRQDVEEIEEATYLEAMMKAKDYTQAELANIIGKSTSFVNERLQIMSYEPSLLKALKERQITFSVAREFNRVKEPKHLRDLLRFAINGGCTPKLARQWVKELDYQNEQNEMNQNEPDDETMSRARVERAVHSTCDICGKSVDSRTLCSVWSCQECRSEIGLI